MADRLGSVLSLRSTWESGKGCQYSWSWKLAGLEACLHGQDRKAIFLSVFLECKSTSLVTKNTNTNTLVFFCYHVLTHMWPKQDIPPPCILRAEMECCFLLLFPVFSLEQTARESFDESTMP